jgi:hypothetical protein
MKNKVLLSAVAAALLSYAGTSSAVTSSSLYDLVQNQGSLSIGDKTFSGFSYTAFNLTSFDAASIQVNASIDQNGVYFLTWSGNMTFSTLNTAVITAGDLKLNYVVSASAGLITMIDQSYTGGLTGGGNGSLSIAETVKSGSFAGEIVANSHLDLTDFSDPAAEIASQTIIGDHLNIDPAQAVLYVTKDINFSAISSGNLTTVTVSEVVQSFHQTSVPDGGMTVMLLGAGLSCVALLKRKMLV